MTSHDRGVRGRIVVENGLVVAGVEKVPLRGTMGSVVSSQLGKVFAAHDIAVAYLFGSRVEGTATETSDHDIAVLFATGEPAFTATVRLGADLAAELDTAVDVVDLDRATLELRGRVAEQGRLLYSRDEPRRVRFEVDARVRWIEFRPVVRAATSSYLRRIATSGLR